MQPSKDGSSTGVPSHYFKIFIRQSADDIESISFIIPNSGSVPGRPSSDDRRDAFLRRSIRRVSQILERTGVALFPDMPAGQKENLKTFRATGLWPTN
jgi:hypothetical protein